MPELMNTKHMEKDIFVAKTAVKRYKLTSGKSRSLTTSAYLIF